LQRKQEKEELDAINTARERAKQDASEQRRIQLKKKREAQKAAAELQRVREKETLDAINREKVRVQQVETEQRRIQSIRERDIQLAMQRLQELEACNREGEVRGLAAAEQKRSERERDLAMNRESYKKELITAELRLRREREQLDAANEEMTLHSADLSVVSTVVVTVRTGSVEILSPLPPLILIPIPPLNPIIIPPSVPPLTLIPISPLNPTTTPPSVPKSEAGVNFCVICIDALRVITLVPCGHKTYCASCFADPIVRSQKECPICRITVTSVLERVYD
jgi:hypothetical protein